MTTPMEAYIQGQKARKKSKDGIMPKILPFSVQPLTYAWQDGWLSEERATKVNCVGGRCPFCWASGMMVYPDGLLRCRRYQCTDDRYPPVEEANVKKHQAEISKCSGI